MPAHDLLALVALARGSVPDALPHLRRALTEDPHDPEARSLLERLEAATSRAGLGACGYGGAVAQGARPALTSRSKPRSAHCFWPIRL